MWKVQKIIQKHQNNDYDAIFEVKYDFHTDKILMKWTSGFKMEIISPSVKSAYFTKLLIIRCKSTDKLGIG